jgi:hypothetical protein
MTVTTWLRGAAIVTAIVGFVDPAWTARRRAPIAIEVKGDGYSSDVDDVRRRLSASLSDGLTLNSDAEPAAVVLVGDVRPMKSTKEDALPISTVAIPPPVAPNVRVVAADDPDPVRVGWAATFHAVVEARGLAGRASRVVLEERGAELAHLEHRWSGEIEQFDAVLRYTPPASGASVITLRVVPLAGETTASDNAADLGLAVSAERFRILVHEPRPSWSATFVRRALEEDPSFDVSTLVRASKGLEVRAGTPPAGLTTDALEPFDAVLVGAPEELRASEIDALRAFARRRGGAIVLLPDRRPSGRYLDLIPSPQFDEVLVENPIELGSIAGAPLRSTELAVHRAGVPGGEILASLDQGKGRRPVVLEWPEGAGRVLFSGAMDAWRFRAAADDGFGRFWRARIAESAIAAPGPVEVTIRPAVPAPDELVTIRAQIRRTEIADALGGARTPAIGARLVGADGAVQFVRLWPTVEEGVFEGRFHAPPAGSYDLQVGTTTGVGIVGPNVDVVLSVVAGARHPSGDVTGAAAPLRLVAATTGGVAVSSADLAPLEQYLRNLPSGEVERTVRPARSLVLVMVFATLLCAEWTIRRRRGNA